jgi:hypothetical protein
VLLEDGAQGPVTLYDGGQGVPQPVGVERAAQPQQFGHGVAGGVAEDAVGQPEPFLSEGGDGVGGALGGDSSPG